MCTHPSQPLCSIGTTAWLKRLSSSCRTEHLRLHLKDSLQHPRAGPRKTRVRVAARRPSCCTGELLTTIRTNSSSLRDDEKLRSRHLLQSKVRCRCDVAVPRRLIYKLFRIPGAGNPRPVREWLCAPGMHAVLLKPGKWQQVSETQERSNCTLSKRPLTTFESTAVLTLQLQARPGGKKKHLRRCQALSCL